MIHEKTIKKEVSFSGIGLHSGVPVTMRWLPAPAGSGIVFKRTDLGSFLIPVSSAHIVSTLYSTTIGIGGVQMQTVEHLLAALYAMGIDNLFIEIDGEEVPIGDGSAAPFVTLLNEAGQQEQDRIRHCIKIVDPITLTDKVKTQTSEVTKSIRVTPGASFQVSYTIAFHHPLIATQSYVYRHSPEAFIREIAPARTFGFLKDVKRLLEQGLAQGGSLENAVVVDENKVLNVEGLRFHDEFVRHKILDLIGDLALLGMPICGHVEAYHSGHTLHTQLIKALRDDKGLSPASYAGSSLFSTHPEPALSGR
jgi:UDP-3-O-[3-hydroxymyristoyl] N-acetylglucosamine deacetylase